MELYIKYLHSDLVILDPPPPLRMLKPSLPKYERTDIIF